LTKDEAGTTTDTNYYHGDHLGSTSDITDENGEVTQHTEYFPYGETYTQDGDEKTDYLYTGKLLDTSTGLYYYGARYYDPELGRFTQADTIVPAPADPQAFNRYSYARNNPINYTDPTGHGWWKKLWNKVKSWIGHAVGAVMGTIAFVASGFNPLAAFQVYSFVSGAINSAGSGNLGAFAIGTAASFALGPLAKGIGLSVAKALGGMAETFIGGALIGAAEFGAAGFASGFVTEYARTGSGSSALRAGAWGAAIGGAIGAAVEGSYMAGWQDKMHGVSKADLKAINSGQTQAVIDTGKGTEGRAIKVANLASTITEPMTYEEAWSELDFGRFKISSEAIGQYIDSVQADPEFARLLNNMCTDLAPVLIKTGVTAATVHISVTFPPAAPAATAAGLAFDVLYDPKEIANDNLYGKK